MRRSIWRADRRGAVAIVMAAGLSMAAASAAVAIDVGLSHLKRSELQRTADMAALAAAQSLPNADAARGRAIERAGVNMPVESDGRVLADADIAFGFWDPATATFTVSSTTINAVRVRTRRAAANANPYPMRFARVIGIDSLDLSAEAIATAAGRELELAMVLDVSGSMKQTLQATGPSPVDDDGTSYAACKSTKGIKKGRKDRRHGSAAASPADFVASGCFDEAPVAPVVETKIAALRRVANRLVDSLEASDPGGSGLRIAVVPFSGRVNIGRHGTSWMSSLGDGDSDWLCTNQRGNGSDTSDDPPSVALFPPFTLNANSCPDARALGLTTDMALVRDTIDSLVPAGSTNTDVGTVWGWRAISERWQGLWDEPDRPAAYDDRAVQKAVVIMTDGQNTPHQTGDDYTTGHANARLRQQCIDMKRLGIRIFTVTFDAPTSIEPLYRQCASNADDWFSPASIAELEAAFGEIGNRLSNRIALVR